MAQGDSIMPMVERREDPIDLTIEDQVDIAVPNSFEEMPSEGMDIEIIQDDDGGVIVDFDPSMRNRGDEGDFNRNLAEELESSLLGVVGNELMGEFDANKASRKDWEDTYRDGLDMLGFTYSERTLPFRGSTGVTHPLLAEAATQFQAQAFNEMLPPDGPVRTAIVGEPTKDKEQQARRVKEFMNYYITNVMEEYTPGRIYL